LSVRTSGAVEVCPTCFGGFALRALPVLGEITAQLLEPRRLAHFAPSRRAAVGNSAWSSATLCANGMRALETQDARPVLDGLVEPRSLPVRADRALSRHRVERHDRSAARSAVVRSFDGRCVKMGIEAPPKLCIRRVDKSD
jgi:hypothetical protein